MPDAASKRRSLWTWIFAGALAAVLLFLSLRGIDWPRVWRTVSGAQWQYLAAGAAISVGTYFLRSLRWRVLLNTEGHLGVGTVFWATMAGYLGNNFLPARGGELVRSLLISGRSSLSKTFVLTTALTERMMDAVTLGLCGSVILLRVNPKPWWMGQLSRATAVAAIVGLFLILMAPYAERPIISLARRMPAPPSLRHRIASYTAQVLLGLRVLHHLGRLLNFLLLTALIWVGDSLSVMTSAHGFGLGVSFPVALLLLTGLGLGSSVPSMPGYVGIYQFVAVTVLPAFGVDRSAALGFMIVAQAIGYLVVMVLGLIGLVRVRAYQ